MHLLLITDTHIPKRAKGLPGEVWAEVESADLVVHAGDWISLDFYRELRDRPTYLLGCYGNNDGPELRAVLPEVGRTTIDGLKLAVVHETGGAADRNVRMDRDYPDIDVLVFGHSHIPWDAVTRSGKRLLNPGSPTDRRREPFCTYMTADVSNGELRGVTLHRIEK